MTKRQQTKEKLQLVFEAWPLALLSKADHSSEGGEIGCLFQVALNTKTFEYKQTAKMAGIAPAEVEEIVDAVRATDRRKVRCLIEAL